MTPISTSPDRDETDLQQEGLFPIRTVSQLTGVNAVTLRAWERRYGLITPHRTPKGHRLYTQADIDLINHVVDLVNRGVPISRVPAQLASEPVEEDGLPDTWRAHRDRMLRAITRFDEAALDASYNEALSLYPVDVVTDHLIIPLLRELGERWRDQPGGIAEEHFFGTYMRNKLGARLHHLVTRNTRPRLLAACLPGEHHELGLLLFCLAASAHGLGFVVLGADMPLDDLAAAAPRSGCDGVLLSGSTGQTDSRFGRDLAALVAATDGPVFVGGQSAVLAADAINRAGAVALGTDTPTAIRHIRDQFADRDGRA